MCFGVLSQRNDSVRKCAGKIAYPVKNNGKIPSHIGISRHNLIAFKQDIETHKEPKINNNRLTFVGR